MGYLEFQDVGVMKLGGMAWLWELWGEGTTRSFPGRQGN